MNTICPTDRMATLPTELLLAILDAADEPSVVALARVSRYLRTLAVDHENYQFLCTLHIEQAPQKELWRMGTRRLGHLERECLPIGIRVMLERHGFPGAETIDDAVAVIAGTLRAGLLRSLTVSSTAVRIGDRILRMIEYPAPNLRRLDLDPGMMGSGFLQGDISSDVFAGCSPFLRTVSLSTESLPTHPVVALAGVQDLTLSSESLQILGQVSTVFPQLRRLRLASHHDQVNHGEVQPLPRTLRHLKVGIFLTRYELRSARDIASFCQRITPSRCQLEIRVEWHYRIHEYLSSFLEVFVGNHTTSMSVDTWYEISDQHESHLPHYRSGLQPPIRVSISLSFSQDIFAISGNVYRS